MLSILIAPLAGASVALSTVMHVIPELVLLGSLVFYVVAVNRRAKATHATEQVMDEIDEDEPESLPDLEEMPEVTADREEREERLEPITPSGSDSSVPVSTPNAES